MGRRRTLGKSCKVRTLTDCMFGCGSEVLVVMKEMTDNG
jgi:hypothetical protein